MDPIQLPLESKTIRRYAPWVIAALTFVAFLPCLRNGFVQLDDDYNYITNSAYRGLGPAQLRWMFFTFQLGGVYQPLSWITNAADYVLWGMNPAGYHLGNILLHCAAAVLVYFMAIRLLNIAMPREKGEWEAPTLLSAVFAALFFSLHPLRVEVVAWASNRSYVLPTLFLLMSILAYLEAQAPIRRGSMPRNWMFASLFAFILSLLSKSIGMTLPAILLMLDLYPLRRWGGEKGWTSPAARSVWMEKIPYVIFSVIAGIVAIKGRQAYGEITSLNEFGLMPRLAQTFFGITFYLEKTLAPLRLNPLYTLPPQLHPFDLLCSARTVATAAITLSLAACYRRWQAGLVLWIIHIIAIFPFLGIVSYSDLQIAADKWFHLASIAWAVFAGAGMLHAWRSCRKGAISPAALKNLLRGAVILLSLFGFLSWRQTLHWHDTESIFRYTIAVQPDCYLCHGNLSVVLNERKDYQAAIRENEEALRINPKYTLAHIVMSASYSALGMFDEGIFHCKKALEINPNAEHAPDAHYNLGYFYSMKGNLAEAMRETQLAIQREPYMADARYNMGYFHQTQGKLDDAAREYREAIRYKPAAANAHYNLGIILTGQGKLDEAMAHCNEAYRLNPALASPLCKRTP